MSFPTFAKGARNMGHPADSSITKWDIFHYVDAVLHHPEYRQRYAAKLRRELSRIPFVSSCHPEAAESSAVRTTPNEGSMHSANPDESIEPYVAQEARSSGEQGGKRR